MVNWDRNTDRFTCAKTWTGDTHPTYGPISVMDSYYYWKDVAGQDVTYDYFPQGYDTTKGQITLNMAYFVAEGCIGYGPEVVQLPGYVIGDYTITITDVASYANDNVYGQVVLTFSRKEVILIEEMLAEYMGFADADALDTEPGIIYCSILRNSSAKISHEDRRIISIVR